MREEAPMWCSPEGIWYVSRYEDVWSMFRNPAFTYDRTKTRAFLESLPSDPVERERVITETNQMRSLLDMDPPDHTRLRSLISRAFTAPTVEAARPTIENFVDELMDAFEGPTVELVSEFELLVPILVICEMLGVPADERDQFVELGDAIARSMDPNVSADERLTAQKNMYAYIAGLIERRRSTPGDDLITRLIGAAEDGRLANDTELVINTMTLLVAGFETTTNLITNAIYQLLQHPDQLAALRADPALISTAIEEVLR